jgi:hypothetical protein
MPINGVDPYAIAFIAMPLAFFAARWATSRQQAQGLARLISFLVVFYLVSVLFTVVGMLLVILLLKESSPLDDSALSISGFSPLPCYQALRPTRGSCQAQVRSPAAYALAVGKVAESPE